VARRISGVRGLAVEIAVILPANSVRSDADIARTAVSVLQWTSYLPANSTQVTVEKGWVTLTGEVEWEFQRKAASRAVRDLMGVTGVSNEIAIKAKPPQNTAKADIQAVLKRRAAVDAEPITVDVDGAKVTLSGTVHTWLDRQLANHAAWATPGVRNVVDHLKVV
jgi:osmotically-inducible protein OsmY